MSEAEDRWVRLSDVPSIADERWLQDTGTQSDPYRLELRTAREIALIPDPPQSDMLLGPLITRGARTIIVGDTGHGKTTLAGQLAVAVLVGTNALDFEGAGIGPVLIVDLEQGMRSIKRFIKELGVQERDDVLYIAEPDGLSLDSVPRQVEALEEHISKNTPSVLMLDPYYKAHRGDANDERAVVDLMRSLDRLRSAYGFALVMPAHPRKEPAGKEGSRRLTLGDVAGSGAVVRGAEVVLAIERLAHGYARLRILKDREGDLPVGEAWPLIFERGEGFKRDPKDKSSNEEIEQAVLAQAEDSVLRTSREWARELGVRHTKVKAVLEALAASDESPIKVVVGPAGRASNARCYGAVPELWEHHGTAEQQSSELGGVPVFPAVYKEQQEPGTATDVVDEGEKSGNTVYEDIPF